VYVTDSQVVTHVLWSTCLCLCRCNGVVIADGLPVVGRRNNAAHVRRCTTDRSEHQY